MSDTSQQDGFALPMVLWACILVGITLAGLTLLQRHSHLHAHDRLVTTQLRNLDEAAINAVIHDLNGVSPHIVRSLDNTPSEWPFEGHRVTIRVQDETGKVDLNFADRPLLQRLFVAAGEDQASSEAFADRIMDWREMGPGKRLHGAKRDDYADRNLLYGAREGPFLSVGELRLVLGMTGPLFEKVAPSLTVYSETPNVDGRLAPLLSYMALTGVTETQANHALLARQLTPSSSKAFDPASLTGHALTISAEVSETGIGARRQVVVRLTRHGIQPEWIYEFQ